MECTLEVEDGGSVRDVNRDSASAQSRSDTVVNRGGDLWLPKGMGQDGMALEGLEAG